MEQPITTGAPSRATSVSHPTTRINKLYIFDIDEELQADAATKPVLEKIKSSTTTFVYEKDRRNVAGVLMEAVAANCGLYPSMSILRALAEDLVVMYPKLGDVRSQSGGKEMWYSYYRAQINASGYLYERLISMRRSAPKTIYDGDSADDWKESQCNGAAMDDEYEGLKEYMKSNSGPIVHSYMASTVHQRRKFIIESAGCISTISGAFPRLFDVPGMITQDFDILFPTKKHLLYSQWSLASDIIIQYASAIVSPYAVGISKQACQWTENDKQIVAFVHLPYLCPLTNKQVKDDENRTTTTSLQSRPKAPTQKKMQMMQKTVKGTAAHSAQLMVRFISPCENVKSYINNSGTPRFPHILCQGYLQTLEIRSYWVVVDKHAIPCHDNFIHALDTCFKAFFVLDLQFPLECKSFWQFIWHGVFQKTIVSTDPPVPPSIRALIGQIFGRLSTLSGQQ